MIYAIILFIVSFFIEILIPNIIKNFIPFFILSSILISAFLVDDKKYYIVLFIFGIIYDLICTNTILLNPFLFIVLGFITRQIIPKKSNFLTALFVYYIEIFIYILLTFVFTFYINVNYISLFNKIFKSLSLNTCYFLLAYFNFIGIKCLSGNTHKKYSYF